MAASKSRRKDWRRYRDLLKLKPLQKKLRKKLGGNVEFIPASDGIKMSAVLEKFIEPYMEFADTEEHFNKLLGLALVAWNASLLSLNHQKKMVNKLIGQLPPDAQADAQEIVNDLIKRKHRHFAQFRRAIVDYKIIDVGDGFHLQVASTPEAVQGPGD